MAKTVIIGGVAGGASCAARLRRLDEKMEITVLEKGNYISFANCGLPYYVSGVIGAQSALLLQSPEMMKARFNIEVRVNNEVTAIDRENRLVKVTDANGTEYSENYDYLVIATGSSPLRPGIEGIDSEKIRTIWNVNDAAAIRMLADDEKIENVCVVGGGFIGLEMAENLHAAGKKVTIAEASNQIMNNLDYEMSLIVSNEIRKKGIDLYVNDGVSRFADTGEEIIVELASGRKISSDLVILAIGVRPNSKLAKDAGLEVNRRGGIIVDEYLRTSDPNIYAVGDVIEVRDYISGEKTMIPLAGPANKQGRMAADNIAGFENRYPGTMGTSIAKVFDLTAASTGKNEKTLIAAGLQKGKDYETITISANSHAMYYPGGVPMMIKVIFDLNTEEILGSQIVGSQGTDKRIDVIATAMKYKGRITDLKELELAYAPPFSSAKDPVNMAGYVGENVVKGLAAFARYDELETDREALCLDVREVMEVERFAIPGALNIPLGTLRDNLDRVDRNRKIIVMCAAGVRAHTASRILKNNGFENVKIYPGGVRFYRLTH